MCSAPAGVRRAALQPGVSAPLALAPPQPQEQLQNLLRDELPAPRPGRQAGQSRAVARGGARACSRSPRLLSRSRSLATLTARAPRPPPPPPVAKVLAYDATNAEPWGPHGQQLAELAAASRGSAEDQRQLLAMLWRRLADGADGANSSRPEAWRSVYKARAAAAGLLLPLPPTPPSLPLLATSGLSHTPRPYPHPGHPLPHRRSRLLSRWLRTGRRRWWMRSSRGRPPGWRPSPPSPPSMRRARTRA